MKKGSKMTLEQRKRVSDGHMGQVPWNKGKKTGKPAWNRGIPMSEEQKRKVSLAKKGSKYPPRSEEHRRKISGWMKGRPSTRKGITMSEETKKRISLSNTGKKRSEESKENISKAKKGQKYPGVTEQRRRAILKRFESGSFPKQTNTKIEIAIKEELIKRGFIEGIDFIHQYRFLDKFYCDFCFLKQKLIIEADGDYYHCNPQIYTNGPKNSAQVRYIKRDKAKKAYIMKADNSSWTLINLWENDIKRDVVGCVDKIEEMLALKK